MNDVPARQGSFAAFVDGFFSVFRGIAFIVRTPRAWFPSLVPALVFVGLSLVGMFLAIRVVAPAALELLPASTSTFGHYGSMAMRVVIAAVTTVAFVFASASLAPALSGPALERIIVLRERALGMPERANVSWLREFWMGFRAEFLAFAVGFPLFALLWVTTFAFPPSAVVTFPLKLLLALALLVWSVLDYPLSMRGVPLRQRLALLKSEMPAAIGFGVGVGLLFAIPLGAVILLPAAVAASTEIVVRRERRVLSLRINDAGTLPSP